MLVAVFFGIPETLPRSRRQPAGLRQMGTRMLDLLRDWRFMRHVLLQCLATAGFFTYIGGSSFVLQSVFHISPTMYAIVFATNAAAMAAASLTFRLLVVRTSAIRLRAVGITLSTAGAVSLLIITLVAPTRPALPVAWALLCVVVAGMGFIMPAATALAQEEGRRSAGSASALQGGLAILTGALVTPLTGLLGYDTLAPMVIAMATFLLAAFAMMCTITRRR